MQRQNWLTLRLGPYLSQPRSRRLQQRPRTPAARGAAAMPQGSSSSQSSNSQRKRQQQYQQRHQQRHQQQNLQTQQPLMQATVQQGVPPADQRRHWML